MRLRKPKMSPSAWGNVSAMPTRTLTRRAVAPIVAPVVAFTLVGAATAPVALAADQPAKTGQTGRPAKGPGSSDYTDDEVKNAGRFLGLLLGITAVLATLGAAVMRFTGGALPVPVLPR